MLDCRSQRWCNRRALAPLAHAHTLRAAYLHVLAMAVVSDVGAAAAPAAAVVVLSPLFLKQERCSRVVRHQKVDREVTSRRVVAPLTVQ